MDDTQDLRNDMIKYGPEVIERFSSKELTSLAAARAPIPPS